MTRGLVPHIQAFPALARCSLRAKWLGSILILGALMISRIVGLAPGVKIDELQFKEAHISWF